MPLMSCKIGGFGTSCHVLEIYLCCYYNNNVLIVISKLKTGWFCNIYLGDMSAINSKFYKKYFIYFNIHIHVFLRLITTTSFKY